MPKERLKAFSIGGVLDYCPECGATGDYELLKERAQKALEVFKRPGYWSAKNDADFNNAMEALSAAIDKARA